jgi:hypothetical protein
MSLPFVCQSEKCPHRRFSLWVATIPYVCRINDLAQAHSVALESGRILSMTRWLRHFLDWLIGAFRSREAAILENLALR